MIASSAVTGLALRKVATIVPEAHLDVTENDVYFMALSHACDSRAYYEFFRRHAEEGDFVVLDNSTVELGEPEDFDTYLGKAEALGASQIIMPDWLNDAPKTLASLKEGLRKVRNSDYSGLIMAVPQGRTQEEWLACSAAMLEMKEVDTLGVSRRYTDMFGGSRYLAVMALIGVMQRMHGASHHRIHLLGCAGDPIRDVTPLLRMEKVRGVDSSLAAIFTKFGFNFDPTMERPGPGIDHLGDVLDHKLLAENVTAWQFRCAEYPSRSEG